MRNTRIYFPGNISTGDLLTLPAGASSHLVRVLRLRKDARFTLFDGKGGEYAARLIDENPKAARVSVLDFDDIDRESPLSITLIQAVSRSEHMDMTIQKATELGISEIVPVVCERSITVNKERAARKHQRWSQIAISACEQSGRTRLPVVHEIHPLARALSETDAAIKLALDPTAVSGLTGLILEQGSLCLLAGPEGGLSSSEIVAATEAGYQRIRFGPRILRTETAAPALIAALQALAGDMG